MRLVLSLLAVVAFCASASYGQEVYYLNNGVVQVVVPKQMPSTKPSVRSVTDYETVRYSEVLLRIGEAKSRKVKFYLGIGVSVNGKRFDSTAWNVTDAPVGVPKGIHVAFLDEKEGPKWSLYEAAEVASPPFVQAPAITPDIFVRGASTMNTPPRISNVGTGQFPVLTYILAPPAGQGGFIENCGPFG